MFWCRLQAMRPLLDAHLPESLFEAETGQIDGTLAHAIERIFVHVVHAAGYQAADAGRMCGGHDSRADVPYRYAKRG
jgi:lipopolysaccharide biosynthesis protein